ncbi:MAG TPA: hypothetical protein VK630_04245 [Reyranella sp.]|nr:hypothetical protein [Reyranella sp.]
MTEPFDAGLFDLVDVRFDSLAQAVAAIGEQVPGVRVGGWPDEDGERPVLGMLFDNPRAAKIAADALSHLAASVPEVGAALGLAGGSACALGDGGRAVLYWPTVAILFRSH